MKKILKLAVVSLLAAPVLTWAAGQSDAISKSLEPLSLVKGLKGQNRSRALHQITAAMNRVWNNGNKMVFQTQNIERLKPGPTFSELRSSAKLVQWTKVRTSVVPKFPSGARRVARPRFSGWRVAIRQGRKFWLKAEVEPQYSPHFRFGSHNLKDISIVRIRLSKALRRELRDFRFLEHRHRQRFAAACIRRLVTVLARPGRIR